jgi:hypothetical protein
LVPWTNYVEALVTGEEKRGEAAAFGRASSRVSTGHCQAKAGHRAGRAGGASFSMRVRFYIDSRTGQPHIYGHSVTESELEEVLSDPGEDRLGTEGARIALGRAEAGRYLRVVYVPDPEPDSVFVITAYTLEGKPLTAYKRRRRKK